VRDVLYVEDLVDAFLLAHSCIDVVAGEAFNIGGGPANTTSLVELLDRIEALHGERPDVEFDAWRAADQRYYVSDTRKFRDATGWRPKVDLTHGLRLLYEWLAEAHATAHLPFESRTVAS
jgi:CDP-paratose 2-epimerase